MKKSGKVERNEVRELLEEKVLLYNNRAFIENDPVRIPHLFTKKEDREIAGFLAASIAWGNRKTIIGNALKLMGWMDDSPHDFILNHSKRELKPFENFVHRTFNGKDCVFFIQALKNIYENHGGLERAFILQGNSAADLMERLLHFRGLFLQTPHLARSEKHLSDPSRKSSAKRLCMFLRWMVRSDKGGVDFGLWKNMAPSVLHLPLDVHTGNVSRELGLLKRKQNDWQAVEEVTSVLRTFDPEDPVKYDFALFGMGVHGDI